MSDGPTTPTAGPDTASNLYRLTDRLRVEVHRPTDDDGEWVDAVEAGITPRDMIHELEIREIVAQLYRDKVMWVQDLDAGKRHSRVFGWRAASSPTGWWSGTIERVDANALRVLVSNILPGELRRRARRP